MPYQVSRRAFIQGVAAAGAATSLTACGTHSPRGHFAHGVASGDPLQDRVVLWTRVTLRPVSTSRLMVKWQIAHDVEFKTLVDQGEIETNSERDFTVKVDVTGLTPSTYYFYRFLLDTESSIVGRTRTLVGEDAEQVSLAVVSCSNYGYGYFNVCKELAATNDLQAVLHVGDYIYEYEEGGYSDPNLSEARALRPSVETVTLDQYRTRYALYRTDPDLQAAHASHPFICVWDDHELTNDAWMHGAQNHQPSAEGDWPSRLTAARRAYREWLPIRDDSADPNIIYRTFELGNLASLIMLDTRYIGRDEQLNYSKDMIWRTQVFDTQNPEHPVAVSDDQAATVPEERKIERRVPFDMRQQPPQPVTDWETLEALETEPLPDHFSYLPDVEAFRRQHLDHPQRSLLGETQEQWLAAQMAASKAAGKPWQILGQQVVLGDTVWPDVRPWIEEGLPEYLSGFLINSSLMGQFGLPSNLDSWGGYGAARDRLLADIREHANNAVVLAGDTHNAWAFNIQDDQGPVAVELDTTSISSPGMETYVPVPPQEWSQQLIEKNKELVFSESEHRGWLEVTFTAQKLSAQWCFVDTVASRDYRVSHSQIMESQVGSHRIQDLG